MGELPDILRMSGRTDWVQRGEGRITSVYRPAMVEIDDFAGICLIRNLSPRGLAAQIYASFAEGAGIVIHFDSDFAISGTVAWSKEGIVGVQFYDELDVDKMLRATGSESEAGRTARSPRIPIDCETIINFEGRSLPVTVRDISQRGVKVSGVHLSMETEVSIDLWSLGARKALVRWQRNGSTGLNFHSQLPFEQFAGWLIDTQTTVRT